MGNKLFVVTETDDNLIRGIFGATSVFEDHLRTYVEDYYGDIDLLQIYKYNSKTNNYEFVTTIDGVGSYNVFVNGTRFDTYIIEEYKFNEVDF